MAGVHTIDKLPEAERTRVLKALAEAGESPDYRGIIKRLQLKCSHMSLWRYHRDKVKPALKRNAAAILASSQGMDIDITQGVQPGQDVALNQDVQSVTVQALKDDPIVRAVLAKQRRLEGAILETLADKQFDAYAKLESVDLKAIEMHAKALQHPGFTNAAPQQAGNTTVVVIMPTAAEMQARRSRVIDVDKSE